MDRKLFVSRWRRSMKFAGKYIPHFDKLLHIIAGASITVLVFFVLMKIVSISITANTLISCGAGILAGIIKEVIDGPLGGTQSSGDFFATAVGSIITAAILFFIFIP
jgi:hypothetical protein